MLPGRMMSCLLYTSVGTLHHEHGGGVHVGEGHQFAVHTFAVVVAKQVNSLSGTSDLVRYAGGGHAVGHFGFHGIAFGIPRTAACEEGEAGTCAQCNCSGKHDIF